MALNRKIWEQNAWQIDNYDQWCEGMPEMFPIRKKSNEEIENGFFEVIDFLIKRATPELSSGETNPYFQKPALNYRIEMAHRLRNGWPPIEPKEAQESLEKEKINKELFGERFVKALTPDKRQFLFDAFVNDYSEMKKHFAEMLNLSKEKINELLDTVKWTDAKFQRWANEDAFPVIKERILKTDSEERKKILSSENGYKVSVICSVWTDIEIDKEKEMILVKGYHYARIDGSTLLKTIQDVEWRKYDALYRNWIVFLKHSKEVHKSNEEVLGWLNYSAYKILHNELNKLKATEEEDVKWKQSGEALLKKDFGVTLRDDLELPAIRNREREILKQAINELEMWYRKNNLNAPDLELTSQMKQIEGKYYSDFEKERERMQYEIIKQTVLRDWERIEKENEIERRDKIINVLISKPKSSEEQSYNFLLGYVKCVEKMNMASPALEDLEKQSNQSKSSWSRRLTDPIFLVSLKKEFKKKQSKKYSKTDDSKNRWKLAEQAIDEKINCLRLEKDALSKKTVQYDNGKKATSPYEDLKDEYNESIS